MTMPDVTDVVDEIQIRTAVGGEEVLPHPGDDVKRMVVAHGQTRSNDRIPGRGQPFKIRHLGNRDSESSTEGRLAFGGRSGG